MPGTGTAATSAAEAWSILQSSPDLQPLSVGLARFNALYSQEPTLIQAAAIMAMALPVVVFFLAQRAFMRGVVFGGVEK